jgi:hypothetical protein
MQRTFALSLMVCAAFAQMAEPEPDAFTTSVEAEPASGADYYDVTLTSTSSNLSFTSQADMINQMKAKILQNLESGAAVSIVIQSLNIATTYGTFTSGVLQADANSIINAVLALAGYSGAGVTTQHLTVNDVFTYTGRRLQASTQTAKVVTMVPLTGDAVTTTHTLLGALTGSASAFETNLKNQDATKYASFAGSIEETPKVQMKVKATVTGQNARPDAAAVGASVGDAFGADLIGTITAQVSSMYTTTPESPESEDHAPIAPMLTIWVALYALVMS